MYKRGCAENHILLRKEKREKEDLNKARSGDTSTEYERVKIPAP
jgi:hypothetical protein